MNDTVIMILHITGVIGCIVWAIVSIYQFAERKARNSNYCYNCQITTLNNKLCPKCKKETLVSASDYIIALEKDRDGEELPSE